MDAAPTADLVYQGICTLFHNSNPKEKEKANKWLEEFQKSVSGHDMIHDPIIRMIALYDMHNYRYIPGQ